MIPLSVPNLSGEEVKFLTRCIETNWVSSAGSFVSNFEREIGKYVKSSNAVACINGTASLFISLKISGVSVGDEVIVPTLSFIAPINTVKYLSAEPVFMDCDEFMNLDPEKLNEFCMQECKLTKRGLLNKRSRKIIKAILPVHIFGNPCNMNGVLDVAQKYNLKVIEDATESLGAYYTRGDYKGRFTGTIGDFGVYSFNGNKIITTGGGGMIVSDNPDLIKKARYLINQAKDDPRRHIHNEIGYNFRLTNIQAALGLAQIKQLSDFIKIKKCNYGLYKKELENTAGVRLLDSPKGTCPNYWFYSLIVENKEYGMDKDVLMSKLEQKGIQTRPIWYLNHLQRPYRNNQAYKIEKALWFLKRVLNLPCSTNLKKDEILEISREIKRLQKKNG